MIIIGIGKILSGLLAEKKMTQSELAKRVGTTPSTISSIIDRDNSGIKITLLSSICKELDVSPEVFFEDFTNRNRDDEYFSQAELEWVKKYRVLDEYGKQAVDSILKIEYDRCKSAALEKVIELPCAYSKASAGSGDWLESEEYDTITVKATPEAHKSDIVIPVDGDSMYPLFSDGDLVLVRRQPDVEIGEIGIFILDNSAYIKKKGDQELISVNPAYGSIIGSEMSSFKCYGKVLGKAELLK